MFETRRVNGYVWPADDVECAKVVFKSVSEMQPSIARCRKFDLVVQAGGNCGVWANHLSRLFDRVVTFEPDPENFACLRQNCTIDNIDARPFGLSDKTERVGLSRIATNAGAHFVDGQGEIDLITLDSLDLPACDFISLDVEGYELLALRGAEKTIKSFRPVIQVEDKGLSLRYGIAKGAVERWLEPFGYRVVKRIGKDVVLAC